MNASVEPDNVNHHPHLRLCIWTWVLFFAVVMHSSVVTARNALPVSRECLDYNGRYAQAPMSAPMPVHRAVDAANQLQGKPYVWGGGHRHLNDRGYDCSGSVSYVLYRAGLSGGPMQSRDFRTYGEPGPGRYISVYYRDGHVFMSICGLRFDTSDYGSGRGDGPRWRPTARSTRGYTVRHPPGL